VLQVNTDELIEILRRHPGLPVVLSGEQMIAPSTKAEWDCFDAEEGGVVVIEGDWSEE
jgi:hypothetical protein